MEPEAAAPPAERTQFRSLDHALGVLCALAEKEDLGISELARRLRLHKSGVHRVLRALSAWGFVEQLPNRRYSLGLKVLELGNIYRLRLDLTRKAGPILKQLSLRTNANAHLARLDQGEVLDLLRIEYPAPLRVMRAPILRRPAHCTALGKALLAHGPADRVTQVIAAGLARMTPRTITQPDRFLNELARVREAGYAVDNEEFYSGMRCIAAPVFNEQSDAVAAISISALITHLTTDRIQPFAQMVVEAARELSSHLGHPVSGTGYATP